MITENICTHSLDRYVHTFIKINKKEKFAYNISIFNNKRTNRSIKVLLL